MSAQTILVAIDSSENARRAVEAARGLAAPDARFVLVNAWRVPTEAEKLAAELADGSAFLDDLGASAKSAGASDLTAAAKLLEGREVSTKLLEGEPGPAICEAARAEDADVVVVGSRGLGGLRSLLLGSVSHWVLHHAERPVLIVP